MSGCQTCGGYGMHHDPIAHGTTPVCSTCWFASGGDAVHCGQCDCCLCDVCGENVSLCGGCIEDEDDQ